MSLSKIPIGVEREETGIVEFRMIEHHTNTSNVEYSTTTKCAVEVNESKQSTTTGSSSNTVEINGSLGTKKLVDAHATYKLSHKQEVAKSDLVTNGKTCCTTTELTVKVPPGEQVYFWQPVAQFGKWGSVKVNSVYCTKDATPPANEIVCTGLFREQSKIIEGRTLFRLKHQNRGTYVNTIKPYYWEAATLGESREYLFKFVRHGRKYVRIEISEPMTSGCVCAYPTVFGGIYFDRRDDKDSRQLWEMSIRNPVDGDVVTFRNKKWPKSGLGYHDGPDTNVYRVKNHDLDKWILEVAE